LAARRILRISTLAGLSSTIRISGGVLIFHQWK
jgi:hypothetical protein